MATKESKTPLSSAAAGSDGPAVECPPGHHFDAETGTCVPDSGGLEVAAYSDTQDKPTKDGNS